MTTLKYLKWWERASLYERIAASAGTVLSITQLSLIFGDAQHIYNVFVFVGQIVVLILPIWFGDKNKNGRADLFDEEPLHEENYNIKVTSETGPVDVEITKEDKNKNAK